MPFEEWDKQIQTTGGFEAWDRAVTQPVPQRPALDPTRTEVFSEEEISQFGTPAQKKSQQWYFRNIRAFEDAHTVGMIDDDRYQKAIEYENRRRHAQKRKEQVDLAQAEHDRTVWEVEAEKLRGKFFKKTYRRFERGEVMVVGGALDFARQLTHLATLGTRGQSLADQARMFHQVLQSPEFQPVIEHGFDKYIGGAAETAPFLIAALVPTAVTKGASIPAKISGFLTAYAVEGNNMYQAALDRGESDMVARARGFAGGVINGGIEIAGGGAGKYFKNKSQAIKVAGSKLAKVKHATRRTTINAIKEGLAEELPQEAVTMVVGGDVPRHANGKMDWGGVATRLTDAGVMGTMLGGIISGPIETTNVVRMSRALSGVRPPLTVDNFIDPENTPLRNERFAIVSAENPGNKQISPEENFERTEQLREDLDNMGVDYEPVTGMYGGPIEHSFYVRGLSLDDAQALRKKYKQESVLVPEGLLYEDGTVNPSNLEDINFNADQSNYFSSLDIEGQNVKFSIPIDFDSKTSIAEPQMSELLGYGHAIPDAMGMQDEERRAYMNALTGKESMAEMTPQEMVDYIWQLERDAENEGISLTKLRQQFQPFKELERQLKKSKKFRPPLTKGELRRRSVFKRAVDNMREKVAGYFINEDRARNIARELDSYEKDGAVTKLIFEPVKFHETKSKDAASRAMYNIQQIFSDNKININGMFNVRAKPDVVKGFPLSDAELIGISLLARNKKARTNIEAMFRQDGIDPDVAINDIQDFVEQDEQLSFVAETIKDYFDDLSPRFWATVDKLGLEGVVKETNYIPILYNDKDASEPMDILQEFMEQFQMPLPGKKHTKARTEQALEDMNLNIFSIMAHASRSLERFINLAPTVKEVNKILENKNFKKQLNAATNNQGHKVLKKWLSDIVSGTSDHNLDALAKTERYLRRNGVVYTLGAKILTVVPKQAISLSTAVATRPAMLPAVLRQLNSMSTPGRAKRAIDRAMKKSAIVRNRDWERDLRTVWDDKNVRKFFSGKKLSPLAMRPIAMVDRFTVATSWNAAYDLALSDGLSDTEAVRYADNVIQATQPMADMSDLPGFFRGGIVAKALTTFMNQRNQNWNFLKHDILGEKKVGKISRSQAMYRFLFSQIMPAMLLGIITRGRLPENEKEILADIGSYLVTPHVFFGRFVYNLITGEWDPVDSAITVMSLRAAEEATSMVSAIKQGDILKAMEKAVGTAGALTGKIPQQAVTTGGGIVDLMVGETDDIKRLYYSEGYLEKYGD